MTEIELFLNQNHATIRKAILCVGRDFPSWRLREFLDHTDLDELIITGYLSKKDADDLMNPWIQAAQYGKQRIPASFSYCPLEKLHAMDGKFAVVFESFGETEDMLRFVELHPTYLLAETSESAISSFTVWEAYHGFCEHIRIISKRAWKEPQILDWEKDPKNDIELSVIFPMYKVEQYLDQCIRSVTAWKAEYVEFLFVNDGSPDHSRDVVLRYSQNDPRVKLLDKPNGGCASARQWGLERAKGRYVGFIDPDDFIDESMFRKLMRAAMVGNYDISYCGHNEYYEVNGESAPVSDLIGLPYSDGVTDVKIIQNLIAWRRVAIWRGIYKMDMIRSNNIHFYTEIRRFDDLPFFIETTASARSVISVNEHLYYYRLDRPGQDVSADDERLYVHFPIFAHLNDSITSRQEARLTDMLQISKLGTHRYALEKLRPEFVKEYAVQAREDLKTTGSFWRSYFLIRQMAGKEHAKYFWAIMTGNYAAINRLRKKKMLVEGSGNI